MLKGLRFRVSRFLLSVVEVTESVLSILVLKVRD